jgi:hypothetical protein
MSGGSTSASAVGRWKMQCSCGGITLTTNSGQATITSRNGAGWLYGQPISTGLAAACNKCGDRLPIMQVRFVQAKKRTIKRKKQR